MRAQSELELGSDGEVVLPAELRERYTMQAGDRLMLVDIGGIFILSLQYSDADEVAEQLRRLLGEPNE
jgi:bifunctional DNA-binding transcriptional regulator/antitoxin component of YhaV-PrlF toxin-antitoxin module